MHIAPMPTNVDIKTKYRIKFINYIMFIVIYITATSNSKKKIKRLNLEDLLEN